MGHGVGPVSQMYLHTDGQINGVTAGGKIIKSTDK